MSCAHFGRDQICTQVDANFSPFGHPIKVNASRVTSINGLLANEIQDMSALKWFFCNSRVLVSAFGHPTQVSTQVQLAPTCDYLPVRLTRALNASVKSGNSFHAFHADVLLTLAKETRGRVSSMQWLNET